jgi:outer membrane protein assembly factor BamB
MGAGSRAGPTPEPKGGIFLSVAEPDLPWGRWIDVQLRRAGYLVHFYKRSSAPGENFIDWMNRSLERADRAVCLLSPASLKRDSWAREEWQAALRMAHYRDGFLLPVIVKECELPPLLGGFNHVSLLGLEEDDARVALMAALEHHDDRDGRGNDAAPFPGRLDARVPFPGGTQIPGPRTAGAPPTPVAVASATPDTGNGVGTAPPPRSPSPRQPLPAAGGSAVATTWRATLSGQFVRTVVRLLRKRWWIGVAIGLAVATLTTIALIVPGALRQGWNDPPEVNLPQRWDAQVGGTVTGASQLIGGMLVVGVDGADGGLLRAFDATTGGERWHSAPVGSSPTAPNVVPDNVYFGSADSGIYAVRFSDGELVWRQGTHGRVRASPLIVAGKAFVGSEDGNIYVLDVETGVELVQPIDTHAAVVSMAAAGRDLVYVSTREGVLYAIDSSSAYSPWNVQVGSSPLSSPVVSGGRVYAFGEDGRIYLVDADQGDKLEPLPAAGVEGESTQVVDNVLYASTEDGRVLCIDLGERRERWNRSIARKDLTSPLVHGSHLYVGTEDGRLFALDTRDGDVVWSTKISGYRLSALAVSGDLIITADAHGTIAGWTLPGQ